MTFYSTHKNDQSTLNRQHTNTLQFARYGRFVSVLDRVQVEKLHQTLIQTASDFLLLLCFCFAFCSSCCCCCGCCCCVPGSGSASYFCISFAACAIIIKYANRTKTFSARMVWDRHRTTVMYIDLGDRVMKLYTLENADQVDSLSVPSKDPQRATNCISK